MKTQVAAAMESASKNNGVPLAKLCKEKGDAALEEVAKYADSKDVYTRIFIAYAAEYSPGQYSCDLLSKLILDNAFGVRSEATNAFYKVYTTEEIQKYGSGNLRSNLLLALEEHKLLEAGIPLIGIFPPNEEAINALYGQYSNDTDEKTKSRNIVIDLTLATMNDEKAKAKFDDLIKKGNVDDILAHLLAINQFVGNDMFLEFTGLLYDQRETKDFYTEGKFKKSHIRVCDVVLYKLASYTDVNVGTEIGMYQRHPFTNDALMAAYRILKSHFQDMKDKDTAEK